MEYVCAVCSAKFKAKPSHHRVTCSQKCKGKKMSMEMTPERRKKIGDSFRGRKLSEETKDKVRQAKLGSKCPEITKRKLSEYWTGRKRPDRAGEKCNWWKGGASSESTLVKSSSEYRAFIQTCLTRDDYTCRKCKQRGAKLNVHHMKNFAQHKSLRTLPVNGVTLCLKCHRLFHRTYGIKNNSVAQFKEFLVPR